MRNLLPLVAALILACGPAGDAAPDFVLPDLGGTKTALSSYRGKVVLVNFWATWCPACVTELPALQRLHDRHGPDGFAVLAVSVDSVPSLVAPFARKRGLRFPVLLGEPAVAAAYSVRALPVSFLLNREGGIARRYVGPVDERALENDILSLLKPRRQP